MQGPNCVYLVECDGCSHPEQEKVLWFFNRKCIFLSGNKFCPLQKEFPVGEFVRKGIDMSEIVEELKKDPPKKL